MVIERQREIAWDSNRDYRLTETGIHLYRAKAMLDSIPITIYSGGGAEKKHDLGFLKEYYNSTNITRKM